jgi:hypothetical protein
MKVTNFELAVAEVLKPTRQPITKHLMFTPSGWFVANRPAVKTESNRFLNYHIGKLKVTLCGAQADTTDSKGMRVGPNVLKLADWQKTHPLNRCQDCASKIN